LKSFLKDTNDIVQFGEVELECELRRMRMTVFASSGAAIGNLLRCCPNDSPACIRVFDRQLAM
jgi:hypothetical protein